MCTHRLPALLLHSAPRLLTPILRNTLCPGYLRGHRCGHAAAAAANWLGVARLPDVKLPEEDDVVGDVPPIPPHGDEVKVAPKALHHLVPSAQPPVLLEADASADLRHEFLQSEHEKAPVVGLRDGGKGKRDARTAQDKTRRNEAKSYGNSLCFLPHWPTFINQESTISRAYGTTGETRATVSALTLIERSGSADRTAIEQLDRSIKGVYLRVVFCRRRACPSRGKGHYSDFRNDVSSQIDRNGGFFRGGRVRPDPPSYAPANASYGSI
eukprot:1179489-Prorocentrum_minimum.AAC.3